MNDLVNNVKVVPAIVPGTYKSAADPTGVAVDLQGFESATLVIQAATVTDAQTLTVEESDDNSTYTTVADDDFVGGKTAGDAFKAVAAAEDDVCRKVGYKGTKRYLKVGSTGAGATGAVYGVIAVLGHPRHAPVA